jgi:NhaP-type Na+/H+ and K+/H+ antiporter
MASLISLIVIISLSLLITKIAAESLVHTGLSRQSAKFQARSAFTGVGFTTREAEKIANHPLRRRIIMSLMLIGNVGIISAIASLMLTFIQTGDSDVSDWVKILIILGSIGMLYLFSQSNWLERVLVKLIKAGLKKFTNLNIKDYVEMLNLTGEYEITVIKVKKGDWLENKKLKDLKLHQEGVNLIAIQRDDGDYIGTPAGSTKIIDQDRLILYGREKNLKNLEKRRKNRKGDQEHEKAKAEQKEKRRQEQEKEKQRQDDDKQ